MKDQGNLVAIEDEQEQMYLVDYLKRMGKIAFLYSMNGVAFKFVTKFRCFFILSFPKLVKLCMKKCVFQRFIIMVNQPELADWVCGRRGIPLHDESGFCMRSDIYRVLFV